MKDINILIFGDSIAYGAYDKEQAGWINRLRFALENKNDNYSNIFNLGIPGDTTIELKERFKRECNARYNADANNIIIFSIGINDSQIINEQNHVSIMDFEKNLIKLIAQALQYTNKILFVGLTRVNESKVSSLSWNPNISYSNDSILKFDRCLESACRRCDISFLNVFNLLNDEDLEDGLHPNSDGHQKLYEKIYKQLEALEWI